MKQAILEEIFHVPVATVWDVVTNNNEVSWRTDLSHVKVVDLTHFIEYTKNGNETSFIITKKEPYHLYSFEMENAMFSGVWFGTFEALDENTTKIRFEEQIEVKNPVMRFLAKFLMNIKAIQKQYITDLHAILQDL